MGLPTKEQRALIYKNTMTGARQMVESISSGGRAIVSVAEAGGHIAFLYYTYRGLRNITWDHAPTQADIDKGWAEIILYAISPAIFVAVQVGRADGKDPNIWKKSTAEVIAAVVTRDMWRPEERQAPGVWGDYIVDGKKYWRKVPGAFSTVWVLDVSTCIMLALLIQYMLTISIQVAKGLFGGLLSGGVP